MKTWIRGNDIQETRAILNLLRKYGFNGAKFLQTNFFFIFLFFRLFMDFFRLGRTSKAREYIYKSTIDVYNVMIR